MSREDRFVMRVSETERAAIKALAEQLQRTESDAVRFVIREKIRELEAQDINAHGAQKASNAHA